MTKRENFEKLLVLAKDNKELEDFVKAEIAALDKKKENKKPTAAQIENEKLKPVILELMKEIAKPVQIKDLVATPTLNTYSNQKISSICNKMVEDGTLTKAIEKRETLFSVVKIAEEVAETDTEVAGTDVETARMIEDAPSVVYLDENNN